MSKGARMSLRPTFPGSAVIARHVATAAFGVVLLVPGIAKGQAWAYPAFQPPRVLTREFNFGVADAQSAGTSLVFQWREGLTPRTQLSLDVGFADPDGEGN